MRKRGARSTIFVFDILNPKDRALLYHWLESLLLVWVHMAPVCGTCSRARQINNGGPRALRSDELPMGIAGLKHRVELANMQNFWPLLPQGILVTLENPSRSLFWETDPFKELQAQMELYFSNMQMCMLGGARLKWIQLAANFQAISEMDIACDDSHSHLPWGKTFDSEGKMVYATSLEAQYPRKFCIALVKCVIRQLQRQNLQILPGTLFDVKDAKVFDMQTARISAQNQNKRSKLPPLMPEVASVAVFYILNAADVPCALSGKLERSIQAYTATGQIATVPQAAWFLRRTTTQSPFSYRGSANWR